MVFVIGNNMYFSNEYSQNMVKAKKRSPVTDVIGLQIVDKTTKISMNILMFWSFFKKNKPYD